MSVIRILVVASVSALTAACQTSDVGVSSRSSTSYLPRQASYRCTEDVTINISSSGGGVMVTDSRGIEATVPASPPGQRTRYSKGIYALILEGRNATWFVSGQTPVECQR